MNDFDVCIVGSGAGGGPVAFELAKAGYSVLVLEKGPWLTEKDYFKDELAVARRNTYIPSPHDEQHVIETQDNSGNWQARSTAHSSWNFFNGNVVGGSSNFMSGYFHRLKPTDFSLLSQYGPIEGANIVDWPINYQELEPYYAKVEREVGVSGKVRAHKFLEPRSSKDFPFAPTQEHPLATWVDQACEQLNYEVIATPRAILSTGLNGRKSCAYSGYCGSYGCATGAKGSSRAALLDRALASGNCQLRPHAMVTRINSDAKGKIQNIEYINTLNNKKHQVSAKIYVLACQAIETARLLLNSTGPKFPDGLANGSGQVGRNLLFAGGGAGSGVLPYQNFSAKQVEQLKVQGPFINRAIQQWYEIDDAFLGGKIKGGTIDIVHRHPAPISRASRQVTDGNQLTWGKPLKRRLEQHFSQGSYLKIEAFCDWLPTDNCFVSLDSKVKDKWGTPVAKVRVAFHQHNLQVGWFLANKGADVLKQLGAEQVMAFASGKPPTNLVAGTCRFGLDAKTSVLNENCRAHELENLYVTDASFMPTGGSVPYTFTIYANAFRVADKIISQLGGPIS